MNVGSRARGWFVRLLRGRNQGKPRDDSLAASKPGGRPLTDLARVAPASTPQPRPVPSHLGRYSVEAQIAQGAMGRIYLGLDTASGARVALKTMMLDGLSGPGEIEARERFLREAETAVRLRHRDIVAVYDTGVQGRVAYIAMELLPGNDLRVHCRQGALLHVEQALAVAARAASALGYAHTHGVVHRDVKPANLMVHLPTDSVKVTDFGIARLADASLTRTGLMLGSPSYMAPEQLLGESLDGRADLYSLGVVLFELLTGRLPHADESISRLMRAIVAEAAPPLAQFRPGLPPAVGEIVARALQKDRRLRFPDGEQFAQALCEAALCFPGVCGTASGRLAAAVASD